MEATSSRNQSRPSLPSTPSSHASMVGLMIRNKGKEVQVQGQGLNKATRYYACRFCSHIFLNRYALSGHYKAHSYKINKRSQKACSMALAPVTRLSMIEKPLAPPIHYPCHLTSRMGMKPLCHLNLIHAHNLTINSQASPCGASRPFVASIEKFVVAPLGSNPNHGLFLHPGLARSSMIIPQWNTYTVPIAHNLNLMGSNMPTLPIERLINGSHMTTNILHTFPAHTGLINGSHMTANSLHSFPTNTGLINGGHMTANILHAFPAHSGLAVAGSEDGEDQEEANPIGLDLSLHL